VELEELETAIAAAELEEEEAAYVRRVVGEGGNVASAVAWVIDHREEPEPEPVDDVPAEEPAGEPTPRQLRSFEAELIRHDKRVREIMGAHVAGFEACETCGGAGIMPPGPRPHTHEWFHVCQTCGGFGELVTGSLRPGHTSRECHDCKGRGYLEALTEQGLALAGDAPNAGNPAAFAPMPAVGAEGGNGSEPARVASYGTPSWMGDTSIG
jgi:hypothetical protein